MDDVCHGFKRFSCALFLGKMWVGRINSLASDCFATEQASGLRYGSGSALAQLKEHAPPWVHSSGNAPYWEAMRMLREGES